MKSSIIVLTVLASFFLISCDRFSSKEKKTFTHQYNYEKDQPFEKIIDTGVYFRNGNDMGVLLTSHELFLIAFDMVDLNQRSFVHLLREDGSFVNNSFSKKKYTYQTKLNLKNGNIKIARVEIKNIEEYTRIRIGQYNQSGNIWSQVIFIDEVFNNPLLKYHNNERLDQRYDLSSKTD